MAPVRLVRAMHQAANVTGHARGGMKLPGMVLLLIPSLAFAGEATVPGSEASLGGVAIGESADAVVARLGEPPTRVEDVDFLDLHYDYPQLRVSFNNQVVAGLRSDKPDACTPRRLCPGDSLQRMRSLYGPPEVSERESERVHEYYAADAVCWLQIRAKGETIASITVACMP